MEGVFPPAVLEATRKINALQKKNNITFIIHKADDQALIMHLKFCNDAKLHLLLI